MTKAKNTTPTPDDQAEADRLAAEAAQAEADRVAAEEAAQAEADRVAAEEAAQAEADRVAAEEAAQAEADRVAAEEAAKAEADRLAAEAAQAEAVPTLSDLLTEVELGNRDDGRIDLIARLKADHGAELGENGLELAGVSVARAPTLERTLADWCMQARMKIMAEAD